MAQADAHHGPDSWLQQIPGLPHDYEYIHVNGALVVFAILLTFGLVAKMKLKNRLDQYIVPNKKFSFVGLVDLFVEGIYGIVEGVMGPKQTKQFFPIIASFFVFILVSNFLGLTPMGSSPSSSINTTLGLSLVVFLYYNFVGMRSHGVIGWFKHFGMGLEKLGLFGVLILFPAMFVIELFSHVVRPISLSLRLFVNMNVDHMVVGAFHGLFAWLTTVPLLLFGIVICTIQAFVFTVLTAVYVQMASEH